MCIENLEDLSKELKSTKNQNVYKLFDTYISKFSLNSEEIEQKLAKEYDCFRCDSCERFYPYEEYSFFDEECIYCMDTQADDEED